MSNNNGLAQGENVEQAEQLEQLERAHSQRDLQNEQFDAGFSMTPNDADNLDDVGDTDAQNKSEDLKETSNLEMDIKQAPNQGESQSTVQHEQKNIQGNVPQVADTNHAPQMAILEDSEKGTELISKTTGRDTELHSKEIDIPIGIKSEYEELEKISPDAAKIAREDSEEGRIIRARLESHGADIAFDRAEMFSMQRQKEIEKIESVRFEHQKQKETHNTNFKNILSHEIPDYVELMSNPNKQAEARKMQEDIFSWIGTKPYSEASHMMDIAKKGRNPHEVANLIKQFKTEQFQVGQQKTKKINPSTYEGALAVQGRGMPLVPSGVGDKDDFDAGWNILSSK